ncbi:hypothetical protein [Leeuwenhoekiella sp. MAR_2009_132]|uniref:hypothetical protein n=1 Tax=Leeuwenhoekiella sp. MAR_2009_132 TaxID=1392489 RepID=UPI00048FB4C2|nr:hypothetical protein [Leeuwenhoekiella sp. MAR_2009_132]
MKQLILTSFFLGNIFLLTAQDKGGETTLEDLIAQSTISNDADNSDYEEGHKLFKIILDYDKKNSYRLPKKIKKGDLYQIYVANINLNRYRISINSKDSTYNTEALNLPTFDSLPLDALSGLVASFNNAEQIIKELEQKDSSEVKNNKQEIQIPQEKFDTLVKYNQQVLANDAAKLKQSLTIFDNLKSRLYTARLDQIASEYTTSFSDTLLYYNSQKIITILNDSLALNLSQINLHLKEYKEKLNDKQLIIFLSKVENKVEKELSEKIKNDYDKLISGTNKLLDATTADKIYNLIAPIIFLNKRNYFKSFPIQFNGDQTEITVTKSPRDTTGILDTEEIKFSFPIFKSRDYYSVGTSFYYSNLKNDRYSVIANAKNDSTTIYNVVDEGRISGEFGISVNFRYGFKLDKSRKLGAHIAFGPGLSIEKDLRPRLLTGLGFSYGEKHNLVLDFGGIFGYVERKSKALDFTKDYVEPPQTTITNLESSGYISLGYTFNL